MDEENVRVHRRRLFTNKQGVILVHGNFEYNNKSERKNLGWHGMKADVLGIEKDLKLQFSEKDVKIFL